MDLTPYVLETGIGNPLMAIAMKKAQEGKSREEIEAEVEQEAGEKGLDLKSMVPAIDAMVKDALVQHTYEEIMAIGFIKQKHPCFGKIEVAKPHQTKTGGCFFGLYFTRKSHL